MTKTTPSRDATPFAKKLREMFEPVRRPKTKAAQKREALRESLWPGSAKMIWSRHTSDGFTTIPRVLPLVMHLIKQLSPKGNPAAVYLELWARAYDEMIVAITDEDTSAYAAGYSGTRAVRTWREHVLALAELGFINVKPEGNREIGQILILNPLAVCASLRKKQTGKVPEEWWTAFVKRVNEIGAEVPASEAREEE